MPEIGRNLIGDLGALDATALPPSGEALVDPPGEAAGTAADNRRQRLHLPIVGMIVDIEASDPGRLSRPEVALPAPDPHKAEIVELERRRNGPRGRARTALHSQKPLSGAWAKVHGQGTAQLQLSNQSPRICQLGKSLIRELRSDRRRWIIAVLAAL